MKKTVPFAINLIVFLTFVFTFSASANLYDGFNYTRQDYQKKDNHKNPWKGNFKIENSTLTYSHDGVLDTTGNMLVIEGDNNSVIRYLQPEKYDFFDTTNDQINADSGWHMSFLCKIESDKKLEFPFFEILDAYQNCLFSINYSNGFFKCIFDKESEIIPNMSTTKQKNGDLISLSFKPPGHFSEIKCNPKIGSCDEVSGLSLAVNTNSNIIFSPKYVQLSVSDKAKVYFDELRIGRDHSHIGLKRNCLPSFVPDDVVKSKTTQVLKESENVKVASDALDCIMIIKGAEGTGTGFTVRDNTNLYVFSNLHILTGNRNLKITDSNGTKHAMRKVECASDRDLVRITLKKPPKHFLAIAKEIVLDESIAVCGNAGGEGIVRPVHGKVLGFGPKKVETDAGFIPGHSGSPMVNDKNEVLGIASYIRFATTNRTTKGTSFTETRRLGYRVDNVKRWLPISAKWFGSESMKLKRHENNVYAVLDVIKAWADDPFLAKLPNDDNLPKALNAWIYQHNSWVTKNRRNHSNNSFRRNGIPPIIAKELLNDIERLDARVKVLFAEKPPRWHLPQFKENWESLEDFEDVVEGIIDHIKELCKD